MQNRDEGKLQNVSGKKTEKLKSLSKNDTNELWNTLNNFSGRKKENADIPIAYFKNLNEEMQDENDEDDILF